MTIDRYTTGGVCVLTPRKNLTGGDETRQLTDMVEEVATHGAATVMIDLGRIGWVNSMGLAGLQRARLACEARGTSLVLAGVEGRIKNIMLTTHLVLLFDTFDTVEEALAAQQTSA